MSCSEKFHILEIRDLSVSFRQYDKGTRQVDLPVISRLNVAVHEGEIVAVVGSSGSGKSLLAHAVMGLLPSNARCGGDIYFLQEPLTPKRLAHIRGKEIALVPQSVTYLDPLMKVGKQVRGGRKDREAGKRQQALFSQYGLPEDTAEKYPFACSGGMSRRILLATALMENPRLIIADEPTPGMELALEVADRIAVFYAGTTVEEALVGDFASQELLRHPYTRALWRAMPRNGFTPIDGVQPYVKDLPEGCVFGPRCPDFSPECLGEIPERVVRCGTVRCIKCREDDSHHHHGKGLESAVKEANGHAGS